MKILKIHRMVHTHPTLQVQNDYQEYAVAWCIAHTVSVFSKQQQLILLKQKLHQLHQHTHRVHNFITVATWYRIEDWEFKDEEDYMYMYTQCPGVHMCTYMYCMHLSTHNGTRRTGIRYLYKYISYKKCSMHTRRFLLFFT